MSLLLILHETFKLYILQIVKPVTFIYANRYQGNNFAKQYQVLKNVFRLLHRYAKFSNIFSSTFLSFRFKRTKKKSFFKLL